MEISIPLWILRDLRCRHCSKFVSTGPVFVTPDCGILCGRCKTIARPNFRNHAYEQLASNFTYPCYNWYKHCSETNKWDEIIEHESKCPYKSCCKLWCVHPKALFLNWRSLPSEENIVYLEVPDKSQSKLICNLCNNLLSCSPVYIDTNGENICHRCYHANGEPPNSLRNLAYEKLANILRFPCIYKSRGCPMKSKFGTVCWDHEVNCYYRDEVIYSDTSSSIASGKNLQLDTSATQPSLIKQVIHTISQNHDYSHRTSMPLRESLKSSLATYSPIPQQKSENTTPVFRRVGGDFKRRSVDVHKPKNVSSGVTRSKSNIVDITTDRKKYTRSSSNRNSYGEPELRVKNNKSHELKRVLSQQIKVGNPDLINEFKSRLAAKEFARKTVE